MITSEHFGEITSESAQNSMVHHKIWVSKIASLKLLPYKPTQRRTTDSKRHRKYQTTSVQRRKTNPLFYTFQGKHSPQQKAYHCNTKAIIAKSKNIALYEPLRNTPVKSSLHPSHQYKSSIQVLNEPMHNTPVKTSIYPSH